MSGTTGTEPTARMKRRARMVTSPAATVSRVGEAGGRLHDLDAERGQPLGRDIRGDCLGDRGEMFADLGEIDLERGAGDANAGPAAKRLVDLGGREQRLRRDDASGQVGAAQRPLFDQDDRHALGDGRQGGGDAAGAAADRRKCRVSESPPFALRIQPPKRWQ